MNVANHIRTPTQYIASLPEDRRAAVRRLHGLIRKAAPGLKPHIAYGMLGYGSFCDRGASGREGDRPVVALASQMGHLSLYHCECDGGGHLPEKNKARRGKVSVGRSCIRLKRLEDLNLELAIERVQRAATRRPRTVS